MKILKVIVDELPEACVYCERCRPKAFGSSLLMCNLTYRSVLSMRNIVDEDCPLRLEHDNARIANEVM